MANIALSALDEHFDRQWRELMGTSYPWSVLIGMVSTC
jgi:hypothetical protein